jgi:hypothetical protein
MIYFLGGASSGHPALCSQTIEYILLISAFFLLFLPPSRDGTAFAQGKTVELVSAYGIR